MSGRTKTSNRFLYFVVDFVIVVVYERDYKNNPKGNHRVCWGWKCTAQSHTTYLSNFYIYIYRLFGVIWLYSYYSDIFLITFNGRCRRSLFGWVKSVESVEKMQSQKYGNWVTLRKCFVQPSTMIEKLMTRWFNFWGRCWRRLICIIK